MSERDIALKFRTFSRHEKTCIRQDVKRFEKIGRDHGCGTLDEYVEYVAERTRRDDGGFLTQRSFELFRGLGAYFGDQLLRNTTMSRVACDVLSHHPKHHVTVIMAESNPGWLISDVLTNQNVIVPSLMTEHVFPLSPWINSLDEIFDQIIDWNQGYLGIDDLGTASVFGEDLEPLNFLAA